MIFLILFTFHAHSLGQIPKRTVAGSTGVNIFNSLQNCFFRDVVLIHLSLLLFEIVLPLAELIIIFKTLLILKEKCGTLF